MLAKIQARQEYLGLSLRSLARQLDVSPTLLSPVLNEKRRPSKAMLNRFSSWLRTPVATLGPYCPSALVDQFVNDRASHLAASTLRFYRYKLNPFAMWCEKQEIGDVRDIERNNISNFLCSYVREDHEYLGHSTPVESSYFTKR